MMFGNCLALATLMGTFRAAGDSLTGPYKEGTPLSVGGGDENTPEWREEREKRRMRFFKVSERGREEREHGGRETDFELVPSFDRLAATKRDGGVKVEAHGEALSDGNATP